KGFKQLDLRRREGAYLHPTRRQYSDKLILMPKGNAQKSVKAADGTHRSEFGLCADVGNMERAVLAYPAKLWATDISFGVRNSYGTKRRPRNHDVLLLKAQQYVVDPTNPRGAFDNSIEHRLHIRR